MFHTASQQSRAADPSSKAAAVRINILAAQLKYTKWEGALQAGEYVLVNSAEMTSQTDRRLFCFVGRA